MMRKFAYSTETDVKPEAIWAVLEDVSAWNTWESGLKSSRLSGEFVSQSIGELNPISGPKIAMRLVEVIRSHRFSAELKYLWGKMELIHYLSSRNGKTVITRELRIRGFKAPIVAMFLQDHLSDRLSNSLKKLVWVARIRAEKK